MDVECPAKPGIWLLAWRVDRSALPSILYLIPQKEVMPTLVGGPSVQLVSAWSRLNV